MANPTSAFGWQMPTSTDLVTDLPADFEVFGQAVDTSLADLKGGTTGQVLSKATNADMDFTWVTTDDANAIQNSIVDAKGDLIAASANDTPARLAVGANGETLVADSSTATGLRYQEPLNLNPVLNSGFDIWQRGTAATAIGSGTFLADRWQSTRTGFAAGASQSRQVTGDTTNLPNIQYCLRLQRDSGNTSTLAIISGQNIETVNSIPYAGKTITFSFYARAGANFSATSNILSTYVASGTGTDQNLITSGTLTGIDNTTTNHTLTTTWQRFTVTKSVASNATQLAFQFFYSPTGTAGANDYFEVTGVMINVGSVAYPFRRTTGTIQGELAACQRYYVRLGTTTGGSDQRLARGVANQTTTIQFTATLPVQLRTGNSTTMDFSSLQAYDGNAVFAVSAVASSSISTLNPAIVATVSGATVKQFYELLTTSTSGYIAFSAEL